MKILRCSQCKTVHLVANREVAIACTGCGRIVHKDWNISKKRVVLTPEQREGLLKDWIATGDNRNIERKYNVSPSTVLNIVKRSNNPGALAILAEHREWNSE